MADQQFEERPRLRRLTEQDRRKHRRILHEAKAKCLWNNGREFEATTVDLSGGGVSLKTEEEFEIGDRLVMYIDGVGRLSGKAVRKTPYGCVVGVTLVPMKREKVIDLLTWIANKDALGLEDERKYERRTTTGQLMVTYDSGVVAQCDVLDMSISGVALQTSGPKPKIGSQVKVGAKIGRCARYIDKGFAVEFLS